MRWVLASVCLALFLSASVSAASTIEAAPAGTLSPPAEQMASEGNVTAQAANGSRLLPDGTSEQAPMPHLDDNESQVVVESKEAASDTSTNRDAGTGSSGQGQASSSQGDGESLSGQIVSDSDSPAQLGTDPAQAMATIGKLVWLPYDPSSGSSSMVNGPTIVVLDEESPEMISQSVSSPSGSALHNRGQETRQVKDPVRFHAEPEPEAEPDPPMPSKTSRPVDPQPQTVAGTPVAPADSMFVKFAAAVGGSLLAGLFIFGRRFLPGLVALLTRPEHVLTNENRQTLLQAVEQHPAITIHELSKATGMRRGAVRYHTAQLERHGHLTSRHAGRTRHFYCAQDGGNGSRMVAMAALRSARNQRALIVVKDRPGVIQRRIAEAIGLSPSQAYVCLQHLKEAGLVSTHREGRVVHYYPTGLLHQVVSDGDAVAGTS